ncbi:MAG: N-succinylarginine dihydrolase [Myxococcales bacterium]|nr:N-succinylarginine dihydrolase [Myxococcales bacterium]MCB9531161.1 N-succinylarginine dihydrolase [Myxococcales bacterium]
MSAVEACFDGLVGPTHNYAGLSRGNVASSTNAGDTSSPRAAALQGLAKMRHLASLGVAQACLPPHERPNVALLRSLGFSGDDARVVERAGRTAPHLLAAASSASAMWTANAATVSPSSDCEDGRVHLTVANLASKLHRSIEAPTTEAALRAIFADARHFAVHAALPAADHADEGAANHTRLAATHGEPGVELFVWGRSATGGPGPAHFPARQAREACEAVARLHRLRADRVILAQQHPAAIDAGVFHNDVIAVGHRDLLLYHEHAFVDPDGVVAACRAALGHRLTAVCVPSHDLSLDECVATYLFNTQLVDTAAGRVLVAPAECMASPRASAVLQRWVDGGHIARVDALDLRESMRNGGGPACLRLRVVLTDAERAAVLPTIWATPERLDWLEGWVRRHYRDSLTPADLADPRLLDETRCALDELTEQLGLGSLYEFQRAGA